MPKSASPPLRTTALEPCSAKIPIAVLLADDAVVHTEAFGPVEVWNAVRATTGIMQHRRRAGMLVRWGKRACPMSGRTADAADS
jgi:hypothetical protein